MNLEYISKKNKAMKSAALCFLLVFFPGTERAFSCSSSLWMQDVAKVGAHSASFVITNSDIATGKAAQKIADVREAIWRHWRQHEVGDVTEKRYSKEGEPTTTTYTFSNDQVGVWSMLVTKRWPRTKGADALHSHLQFRAYMVRRMGSRNEDILEQDIRKGSSFRLAFYDAKGTELGSS